MTAQTLFCCLVTCLTSTLLPSNLLAQTARLQVGASTSGGGTVAAASATLSGTLGQPSIARLHSRDFTIDGGIWGASTPIADRGAPSLTVRYTSTNTVVVSWPITWPGFELWEGTDQTTTNWIPVAVKPIDLALSRDRTDKMVLVPATAGSRFFQLKHP